MAKESKEILLAQEQGVIRLGVGGGKAIEGALGIGEKQGTLILTNLRLLFVCGSEEEVDLPKPTALNPFEKVELLFSDVKDLQSIPQDPANLSVPLSSIVSVTGRKGELARPRLVVKWKEGGKEIGSEFVEQLTGSRSKNLNDWAAVIEKLKKGQQPILRLPPGPPVDTLEGKIMKVLGDMQEKGVITIEAEVEKEFNIELDPDEVQASCDRLVSQGLIDAEKDSSGDTFYQKRSPLGEDDLSS